jgi:hypothetical protein
MRVFPVARIRHFYFCSKLKERSQQHSACSTSFKAADWLELNCKHWGWAADEMTNDQTEIILNESVISTY